MEFKAVYFGHSGVVVNKSEKNDKIALKGQLKSTDIFLISPWKHMLWVMET